MYVTAAEQIKAPSDSKEIFFPWEVWGRGGRGKMILRAERLRCWRGVQQRGLCRCLKGKEHRDHPGNLPAASATARTDPPRQACPEQVQDVHGHDIPES